MTTILAWVVTLGTFAAGMLIGYLLGAWRNSQEVDSLCNICGTPCGTARKGMKVTECRFFTDREASK